MEETLEQKEQLKQWASERDAILSETYRSKVEQDSLISLNNQLTQSNKELEKSVKTLSDTKNSLTNEIAEMKKTVSDSARIKNENGQLVAIQKGLNENILQQQETVQLKTWVAQRDSISNEISSLITQKDKNWKLIERAIKYIKNFDNRKLLKDGIKNKDWKRRGNSDTEIF